MKRLFFLILTLTLSCEAEKNKDSSPVLDTTRTVRYFGVEDKTVLELLETSHQVEKKTSSMGSFVESIDGMKNRPDRFWLYYVNAKKPNIASDRYKTQTGDTVEWRFEANYEEEK